MTFDRDMAAGRHHALISAMSRWTLAALIVVVIHGFVLWLLWRDDTATASPSEASPAIMIDLSVASSPETPPEDVAPAPQPTATPAPETPEPPTPDDPVEPPPDPVQAAELSPSEPVVAAEEAPTVDTAEPSPKTPLLSEPAMVMPQPPPPPTPIVAADVILPPPPVPTTPADVAVPQSKPQSQPKPEPPRSRPMPAPPTQKQVVAERPKPAPPRVKRGGETSAPPRSIAPPAQTAAAPSAGASAVASISPASWRGQVAAHLNRFKRAAGNATGSVTLVFTINRSGQVLSSSVTRSSGNAALDAEAASLPRRASPVPPPPPSVPGGSISIPVPLNFR